MMPSRGRSPWYAAWIDDPRTQELGRPLLHHATELVGLSGVADDEVRGALLDAVLDTLVAQQHGSTRVPVSDALAELAGAAAVPTLLSTDESAYRPLIVVDGWLYHQRTLHYERELARQLRARLELADRPAELDAALEAVVAAPTTLADGTPVVLSDEQLEAVRRAARMPLCVVTGGPGTGKTSIVVSLMRALVRAGVAPDRISLAAPTGKAANRLGESIDIQLASLAEPDEADQRLAERGHAPVTLHRLLKYSGTRGRFVRDESDPIEADWVIVDEASMIDLVLMERLVRCVPTTANLVLLGDVEQLPSVETGTVLRDLIGADDRPHVARLRQSFRMDPRDPAGRAILSLAGDVRDGNVSALETRFDGTQPGFAFEDVPTERLRPRLLDFVDTWFRDRVTALDDFTRLARQSYRLLDNELDDAAQADIARLFAHYDRFRILCLTRVFASGSEALNAAFHLRMARQSGVEGIPDYVGGEPVLMLRNDYERRLFNGDQGIVLWVDNGEEVRLAAVFADDVGYRAHHLSGLSGQITHAWAMTVHKSQGSEFDDVALLLPEEDIPLLSRELLYTAITRARKSVTILGARELFMTGAARSIERWSGLSERLFG